MANFCDKIIKNSFYALFFFVPLILTPWNFELFEYNKMMLTYSLTTVILGAWLMKMVLEKKISLKRTPLDFPLLLFFSSQVLSTFFSLDRYTSIWGYYSRFHQGLLATFSYLILYYAFVNNLEKKEALKTLGVALGSGLLVSTYGIAEHFGIDAKYWIQDVKNRVFSTLGQPNWLATYLSVLIPISLGLVLTADWKKQRFLLTIYGLLFAVFYLALLYTKSRSGFLGFSVGLGFFVALYFWLNRQPLKNIFSKTFVRLHWYLLVVLVFIGSLTFVVGSPFEQINKYFSFGAIKARFAAPPPSSPPSKMVLPPAPALEVGGTESGTIRKIVWQGALNLGLHYPLFGSGVETFAYAYYQFRPREHNFVSEWDFLYNKAHNEYLNFFATTGFFGLGTYLLLIFWFVFTIVRYLFKNQPLVINNKYYLLLISLLAGYLSILVSNFFGFSVVMIGIFFFLIPAFSFILTETLDPQKTWVISFSHRPNLPKTPAPNLPQWLGMILILLTIFFLLFTLAKIWRADKAYALGNNLIKIGDWTQAYQSLQKAIKFNGTEPTYHNELSQTAAVLAVAAAQENQATLSGYLINEALAESQKAIRTSPKNVNFWKTRTKVFYTLSQIDPQYNQEAVAVILEAKKLAPTDAKIFYNLGLLYARTGKIPEAIKTLEETIALKPNYRDAHYALALFYKEAGMTEKAIEQLTWFLQNIAPKDAEFEKLIEEWKK